MMRDGGQQVMLVESSRVGVVRDTSHRRTGRALPWLAKPLLDGILDEIVEFVPAAGEELDAVVGHRVVRSRQHDAEISIERIGEESDARRRQNPYKDHIYAGTRQTCDESSLEELTTRTRVTADDSLRPVTLERASVTQHMRSRHSEVERQLGRHIAIGEPSNSIGAEEPAQRTTACCTEAPCEPS